MSMAMVGAAAVTAGAGYMATKSQNKAAAEAAEGAGMPIWDPRQEERLFGGTAWNPQMPQVNADAMNYGNAMMGGYNPATGPQGPMKFQDMLKQLLNDPGDQNRQDKYQGHGLQGLLGYGGNDAPSAAPPPLMSSNPFYGGANVDRPQDLGYDLYGPQVPPQQQQFGQPAPQQQVAPPQQVQQHPQGANYGGQANARPGNWIDILGEY